MGATGHMQNAPPFVDFTTVALGGFRGIMADILWLRASFLQDEGKYFELVQLADWITKLEPRFAQVWSYHAWNMGYNVSIMMPDPSDRWRWVNSGIQLLRDEALVYNPDDPFLYFQLAWFFQFKIGQPTDVFHLYYKKQWAGQMTEVLGGPRPDYDRISPEKLSVLEQTYKLHPDIMREIERLYGRLDWRLPNTHAIYWAYMGVRNTTGQPAINCDRVIFQSLAVLFQNGTLTFDPAQDIYMTRPAPEIVPGAIKAYEAALAKYGNNESITSSYHNFLKDVFATLYRMGLLEESRKIFDKMAEKFPSPDTGEGYDSFVKKHLNSHNIEK
jgi:tetratricopeptide (TPR) repeat protein